PANHLGSKSVFRLGKVVVYRWTGDTASRFAPSLMVWLTWQCAKRLALDSQCSLQQRGQPLVLRSPFLLRNANAMLTPRSLRETNKHFIDEAVQAAFSLADRHPGTAPAWERLIHHVHQQTDLLHPRRKCGDLPGNGRCPLVGGLLALALHHADWLRPVELWTPTGTSAWPQFTSLAQHLFAKYPIPVFMTSAWFGLPPGEKLIQHEWYKKLGLGVSVRSLDIPLLLTKTMAHWFLQAPDHYSILAALRWGQVRGLRGSEELAKVVAATRLSKISEQDDFWMTALRFFARHPTMELNQVGPIVDFLYHQRFQVQEVFVRGVIVKQEPPQPDFS